MKHLLIVAFFAALGPIRAQTLEEGFKAPPDSAKPHTWYHMMNGNVSKEGITCDFEALAKAGIGGVQMFDAGCAIPPGPLKFNSDDWFDMFAHAHKEAKRLGLEICIPNCSGWSSSGGPWNPPANGMKVVRFTETAATGPSRFSGVLPREKKDNGFYDDIAVLAYPTPKGKANISNLANKTFASRGNVNRDSKPVPDDAVVAKDSVVDLTSKMNKDGTLEWDVPAGNWTILRIGYICNGRCNHPASEKGRGLEVDKLSASAMDYHFDQYVTRLCKTLGIEPGKIGETGFNNILVDSYEVGLQNWTQGFDKTFEQRMGYSLTRYLPVFAGRIVGSVDETERFLEDFRRVVADLFAENYAGRLTELCHQHGLLCSIEPYGNCPADDLQYGQDIDIPMAEYWSTAARGAHHSGGIGNSRLAATLAHVWGRRYAATESFTASPGQGGRWLTTPYHIKAQGDKVFAAGINRIIYHRFTHQPWPGNKYVPGMTMGRWGMHLDRTQTWWPLANDWFRYQTRCQWMLQEGTFAADVLFWCGEEVPLGGTDTKLPAGYDYDYCATKAFMALKVVDGRVVTPGGVSYALLVLPKTDTMSKACVRKVLELLDAGAKICSVSRPMRTPGLREVIAGSNMPYPVLVDAVWAKGVIEKSAGDALASLGIAPDFTTETPFASWIHRRSNDADWYFVALDNSAPTKFEASFRQAGRVPEIWDAETGGIRDASAWREENGRTIVSLDYPISGSAFVVFRRKASGPHVTSVNATVSALPDPALPEKTHTLVIKKAEYGVFDAAKTPTGKPIAIDVTDKLAALVKDGTIDVAVENDLAGCDPLFKTVKKMVVTYVFDGKENTAKFNEHDPFRLPYNKIVVPPKPDWEWKCGKILAWQPMSADVAMSDGTMKKVTALPPAGTVVAGPWNVSFPAGWEAPASTTFDTLVQWNEHDDPGIKYFSGTATYRKCISVPRSPLPIARIMLDLGVVKNFAEVTVNGKKFPVLWKPPFRVDITDAVKGIDAIDLEIKVTNLWPNRLIGDDRLYADDCEWVGNMRRGVKEIGVREIPKWVKEGKPSPTGRHTFTTWKHWSKEDNLLPSGLIGPVCLRFGTFAKPVESGSAAMDGTAGTKDGSHLLVLQCGSDWCESGDYVRRVFESAEFRDALGPGWELAVYDDMDEPTPEVKESNKKLAAMRVESVRFPAITCLTAEPRRFFAQLENIPFDVTAKDLAAKIAAAAKAKDEAVRLFGVAKGTEDAEKSADAYGEAFALLSANVGDFGKRLREGSLAYADEWKALQNLDRDDRFGWKFRFTSESGESAIAKATKFRKDGDFAGGAGYIASLLAIPTNHLTVVQRQAIDIAEYALWRTDPMRKASNAEVLHDALSLGRDTVWGQCALGYLILSGEKHERRARHRAEVRPRPEKSDEFLSMENRRYRSLGPDVKPQLYSVSPVMPAENDKTNIVRSAVLRRIGEKGWNALASRPGAGPFIDAFFGDRVWMEDFAWSGECNDWAGAILSLESLVFQDAGRWLDGGDCTGRRFVTALALSHPGRDEAWLADVLDAYRATALAKRLHKLALAQPVWQWRFAVKHTTGSSCPHRVDGYFDQVAEQQRLVDMSMNAPLGKYANGHARIPYKTYNCIGEWVQTEKYYEPWLASGEWIVRRYSPIVGGVCGEVSKYAVAFANSHGLPATTAGQPGHCAYARRLPGGRWEIENSIDSPTDLHLNLFPGKAFFTYVQAFEGTFEGERERRLDADRRLELAKLAEDCGAAPEEVAGLYAAARSVWPSHYNAWRLSGEWLVRAGRPLDEHRAFADGCVAALKGWRQPLWDVLSPYFARVEKERGAEGLADELVRMMPALRQGGDAIREEGSFENALEKWAKPLRRNADLKERVAAAALEAQQGTKDYFSQVVAWSSDLLIGGGDRFDRLSSLIARLSGGDGNGGRTADFGGLILAASKSGNPAAFRRMAALAEKIAPRQRKGKGYPEKDFGGALVSADALLSTSSTCKRDDPSAYPFATDALPCVGNAFHTDWEKSPWAMVTLVGECRVRGVLVVNANPVASRRDRQVPIEVQVSADGKEWNTVFSDAKRRDEYRVDLGENPVVARFVRVRRVPGARSEVFHLNKILVYGDRLY